MKEATFTADDLEIDGEITAVAFSDDGSITVCYRDAWQEFVDDMSKLNQVQKASRKHQFIDFTTETFMKLASFDTRKKGYVIDAVMSDPDDGFTRVWFVKA